MRAQRLSLLQLGLLAAFVLQVSCYDSCATIGYGNATATAEVTQGPYHLDETIFRANVTDGQDGIPLRVDILVLDTNCQPIPDAFVEIWHANATGYYSGIVGQNPGGGLSSSGEENEDTDYLRGMTQTDENGIAELFTIFPGIYSGRAVHIHYGVHIVTNTTGADEQEYEQSHLSQIGQIFFEDSLVEAVTQIAPYTERGSSDIVYLADDMVYTGDTNTIANLTLYYPGELQYGGVATNEVIVDPSVMEEFMTGSSSAGGMGGGMGAMGPGMGGPGGAGGPQAGAGMGMGAGGLPANGPGPSDIPVTVAG